MAMATPTFINHPRCAILPSPEKLDTGSTSPGQDETNTRGDFDNVWQWLTSSRFLNTRFYVDVKETVDQGGQLNNTIYKSVIKLAFDNAFDAIRNTSQPEHEEMVLLYYVGHGLSEQGAKKLNKANLIMSKRNLVSSSPRLDKVGFLDPQQYFAAAESFLTPHRTVKGGELCLHDVGFCDLQGLLEPWIAAVKQENDNATGVKKNKHLVIIADSCYSGVLVDDLHQLALMQDRPWNENGCTVTVQSASGSGEQTFGDYFTPCFVHFNKPENKKQLRELKKKWDEKSEIEKNAYRAVDLPSPEVVTTMPSEKLRSGEDDPILVLPRIQGARLTLFRDAGFFKFCFLSLSGIVGSKARALTPEAAREFLLHTNFNIRDYKLKKMAKNDTPMALVLVDDPKDNDHVVCVHIHFSNTDTSLDNVSGVNLIHHNKPKKASAYKLCLQDTFDQKQPFTLQETTRLVTQCRNYVELRNPGLWENSVDWKMKKSFKTMLEKKERSDWGNNYVWKATKGLKFI